MNTALHNEQMWPRYHGKIGTLGLESMYNVNGVEKCLKISRIISGGIDWAVEAEAMMVIELIDHLFAGRRCMQSKGRGDARWQSRMFFFSNRPVICARPNFTQGGFRIRVDLLGSLTLDQCMQLWQKSLSQTGSTWLESLAKSGARRGL